jgi:DNA-binding SARP family transcriptional activator/tetratricopeptide (TPR) repeat protein
VEYRILGPLEVSADGRALDLGGSRQQRVLAALLLTPNRIVPLDRLVEMAWDGEPPATADRQVRNRVAALRAVLTRFGGFIDTQESGYVLRVGPGELDAEHFDELAARGREARDPATLREALALWRGPVLAGIGSEPLRRAAAALEEKRLVALEECVDLELATGRPAAMVAELRAAVGENPLRERLVGQLMSTLYRVGQRDEALDVYRALATRLADELGIDPSPELRRLREVAAGAAPARAEPAVVPPRQLPADVSGFTGRVTDLARLDALLSDGQLGRTVVISAIDGTAGVGKTALAVHWAHHVRDKFPDGQLYANLRGYAPNPALRPIDALSGFLRALGMPGEQVPAGLDAAAKAYRELLTDRRVLVVLDNAASADQIRPLLPDGGGCLALVTSRDALGGGMAGVHRLVLDVLAPDDARELLMQLLGEQRVAAEPAAAAELARLCAHLPLALRIAAANLPDDERIADYAARLGAGDRLAVLAVEGDEQAAVRATFDLSYASLPEPTRRMFRLLGLTPGPEVSADVAASLAAVTPEVARELLDRLTAAHLIDERAPGRYAFHDLLRLYASELVGQHEADADRHAARHRMFDHYLQTSFAADRLLSPYRTPTPLPPAPAGVVPVELADAEQALAWFTAEQAVLMSAIPYAAETGFDLYAADLAARITDFLNRRAQWPELAGIQETALLAAHRLGDRRREARAHGFLGLAYIWQRRYDEAEQHLRTAAELYGHDPAGGKMHLDLGLVYNQQGRYPEALAEARQALKVFRSVDYAIGQARALSATGWVLCELGEYTEALADCQAAQALYEQVDDKVGLGSNWDSTGYVHYHLGEYAEAIACYRRAHALYAELGDRRFEQATLVHIGDAYLAAGNREDAREALRAALVIADEIGDPERADLRAKLIGLASAG